MGGLVTGYNVTYTKVNSGQPLHKAVFQICAAGTYIANLPGMTTYEIKVGLMRDGGETIWSEEVLASTLPRGRYSRMPGCSYQDLKNKKTESYMHC